MPRGMSLVVMETAKAVFKYIEWSPFCFDVHGSIRLRVPILLLRRRSVPWGRCTPTYGVVCACVVEVIYNAVS